MRLKHLRTSVLIAAAAAIGWTGWSGHVLSLPVAALFPALWSWSGTRWQATAVSAAYFLAASRGLPQGVETFYSSDIWPGLLLWLIASAGFVTVHSALWTDRANWQKPLRFLIACVVMAFPPFGITGWAHPFTAAGVLFPSWGWWGLLVMAAGLGIMTTSCWPAAASAMIGFWLWSAAEWTEPNLAASWRNVDLEKGASLGRDSSLARQKELVALVRQHRPGTVVVLPESALGFWTPTLARFWARNLEGTSITVVAGASLVDADGYDNVLVVIGAVGGEIIYRQRMPVPGSMWRPWAGLSGDRGGARAHFLSDAIIEVGGAKIAPLICYEQLIVWPLLQSMLHEPDVIVAIGNGWWTAGTSIADIQRASTQAWARLFAKPLVFSFNT